MTGNCRILPGPDIPFRKRLKRGVLGRLVWRLAHMIGIPALVHVPDSDGTVESAGVDVMHFVPQTAFRTALPSIYTPHDLQFMGLSGIFYAAGAGHKRAAISRILRPRARRDGDDALGTRRIDCKAGFAAGKNRRRAMGASDGQSSRWRGYFSDGGKIWTAGKIPPVSGPDLAAQKSPGAGRRHRAACRHGASGFCCLFGQGQRAWRGDPRSCAQTGRRGTNPVFGLRGAGGHGGPCSNCPTL